MVTYAKTTYVTHFAFERKSFWKDAPLETVGAAERTSALMTQFKPSRYHVSEEIYCSLLELSISFRSLPIGRSYGSLSQKPQGLAAAQFLSGVSDAGFLRVHPSNIWDGWAGSGCRRVSPCRTFFLRLLCNLQRARERNECNRWQHNLTR